MMARSVIKISKANQLFQQLTISPVLGTVPRCNYAVDAKKQREFQKIVDTWDMSVKKQESSKAMKAYLERAREQDEFMKQQRIEYEIGKRHLANMMGEDPATFTQAHVDSAIRYLFPSGLFDKAARPHMKPPEQVFPARKAAAFDPAGRPFHFLFYTTKPNFAQVMFDMTTKIEELKNFEDSLIKKKAPIDYDTKISTRAYRWVTNEELQKITLDVILENEYSSFIVGLERFADMPYSDRYADFFKKYQRSLGDSKYATRIPPLEIDEDGRNYITVKNCTRKNAKGEVTIRSPGTGKITINGEGISYFKEQLFREQVSPFFIIFFSIILKSFHVFNEH